MRIKKTRLAVTPPRIKTIRRTVARDQEHLRTGWHEVMHWLYDAAAWGRKTYRVRFPWLHIHLVPGSARPVV